MERTAPPSAQDAEPLAPGQDHYGDMALPHAWQFAGLIFGGDHTYLHDRWDEARRRDPAYALQMRNDTFLSGLMQERILSVVSLKHHLEVDDETDPRQILMRDVLSKTVQRIPNLKLLLWDLLEAVWWGRYGDQVKWKWSLVSVKPEQPPAPPVSPPAATPPPQAGQPARPPSSPAPGTPPAQAPTVAPMPVQPVTRRALTIAEHWPVQGDKIGHAQNHTPYILVNSSQCEQLPSADLILSTQGRALLLSGSWRERFILHKHLREDTDFYLGIEQAEAVHGLGVRDKIFWLWFLKQEYLSWITTFVERVGLGTNVWFYDGDNPHALAEAEKSAKDHSKKSNLFVPIFRDARGTMKGAFERIETPTQAVNYLQNCISWLEKIMERYIVGQTASADSESSGLGTHDTDLQADTKSQITRFDAENLEETLTRDWIRVAARYTFPEWPELWDCVRWKFALKSVDPQAVIEAACALMDKGMTFRENELRALTGLADPVQGDKIIGGQQQPAPGQGPPGGEEEDGGQDGNGTGDDDNPAPFQRRARAEHYADFDESKVTRDDAGKFVRQGNEAMNRASAHARPHTGPLDDKYSSDAAMALSQTRRGDGRSRASAARRFANYVGQHSPLAAQAAHAASEHFTTAHRADKPERVRQRQLHKEMDKTCAEVEEAWIDLPHEVTGGSPEDLAAFHKTMVALDEISYVPDARERLSWGETAVERAERLRKLIPLAMRLSSSLATAPPPTEPDEIQDRQALRAGLHRIVRLLRQIQPSPGKKEEDAAHYAKGRHGVLRDLGPAEHLARQFAQSWNALHAQGYGLDAATLQAAHDALLGTDWHVVYTDADGWQALHSDALGELEDEDEGAEHYAYSEGNHVRAPKGGVVINGKTYRGGQFLPHGATSTLQPKNKEISSSTLDKAAAARDNTSSESPQPTRGKAMKFDDAAKTVMMKVPAGMQKPGGVTGFKLVARDTPHSPAGKVHARVEVLRDGKSDGQIRVGKYFASHAEAAAWLNTHLDNGVKNGYESSFLEVESPEE